MLLSCCPKNKIRISGACVESRVAIERIRRRSSRRDQRMGDGRASKSKLTPPPKQSHPLAVTGAFKDGEVAAKSKTVFLFFPYSKAEVSGDVERTSVSRARLHEFGGPWWVIGSERSKRREGAKSEDSWRKGFKGVDEWFLGKERHEMTCSSDEKRRLRWWQGFGDEDEDRGQDPVCARALRCGWVERQRRGQDRALWGKTEPCRGTRACVTARAS